MKNVAVFRKRFLKDEVKEKSYHQKACVSLYPSDRKSLALAIFMDFFFLHTLGTVLEQACYHKTMIANTHMLFVELKLYHRIHRLRTS